MSPLPVFRYRVTPCPSLAGLPMGMFLHGWFTAGLCPVLFVILRFASACSTRALTVLPSASASCFCALVMTVKVIFRVNIEKYYFWFCLKSVYKSTQRHLPPTPIWLDSHNAQYLEAAELLSQNISLYAWLSYKFPTVFVDPALITNYRKAVSRYLERALLSQARYGDTLRELDFLQKRR